MPSRRPSIRLLVILIITIPIFLLWIAMMWANDRLGHQIERSMSSTLTRATAQQVFTQIQNQLVEAERLSDLYEYRFRTGVLPDAPSDQWIARFNESLRIRPSIAAITYALGDGRTVYAMRVNQQLLIGRNFDRNSKTMSEYDIDESGTIDLKKPLNQHEYDPAGRPWYIDTQKSDSPRWTNVYSWFTSGGNQSSKRPNIVGLGYSRKLLKEDRSGVLLVDITLNSISNQLAQSELAKLGTVFLVDEQNRVIARSDENKSSYDSLLKDVTTLTDTNAKAVAKCLAKSPDGDLDIPELDRTIQMIPITPSSGIRWHMATIFPISGVTGKVGGMFQQTAWIIALVTAITLAIALWMTRWATRPVRQLATIARHVGQGQFDEHPDVKSTAEFEQLSDAFQAMSEGVKEQIKLRAQKEAAEQAMKTRTEFYHRVTHEFCTPLNAMIGYSEILDESPAVNANPVVKDDVRKLKQASQNLLRLVNDLLNLARAESGRMTVDNRQFELKSLISEVDETTRPLIQKNGNTMQVECDDQIMMNTDRQKLLQILLNIVSNAAKYTLDGTVTLSVVADKSYVHIRVVDTGQGIEAEKIKQMFEPFSRGQSDAAGTGLGLTIARQFTELLGGVLDLTSDLCKGTCVDLYFPRDPSGKVKPRSGETT